MPQQLPQQPGRPGGVPSKPVVPPPDKSIFRGRQDFKTGAFRYAPRIVSGYPGASSLGDMKNLSDRLRKDYGDFITKPKVPFVLQKEKRRISETPDPAERIKRQREYKLIEQQLLGK